MATKQVIAELLVEIGVDAREAEKAAERIKGKLKQVGKAGDAADKGVSRSEKALKRFAKAGDLAGKAASRIGQVLTGASGAIAGLGTAVLTTGARFEKLRAQLKTTTGSAEAADKAFKFIREFAAGTPFQVDQITEAFVKLNNFGIEPTQRTLEAFGNFASAMGKELDQFIEAVTDATTGEFERLKEFGIKTKSEGDRVAFTFRGVTTEVGKNSAEIQEFLTGLSEQNFGGAMAAQMETAGGMLSNLQDAWSTFLDTVANLGPLEEFKGLIGDLRDAAGGRNGLAKQLAGVLTKAIQGVRRLLAGNLIPVFERILSILEFVINNFDKLAAAFAAGKLISGVASLASAFSGLGLSITALTGPVGIAIAALGALGFAAVQVTKQINSIPKIPPPPGPVIDEAARRLAPESAPQVEAAQNELQELRRQMASNPALDIESNRRRAKSIERRIERLNEQRRSEQATRAAASFEEGFAELGGGGGLGKQVADINELRGILSATAPADEAGAESDEVTRGLKIGGDIIGGGGSVEDALAAIGEAEAARAEEAGFGIVGKQKGSGRASKRASAKKKKKQRPRSATTVSEFFAQAARGDLGKIADRTPSTRDIEPTVAVDITNNNIKFDAPVTITGATDPVAVGKEVTAQVRAELGRTFKNAGDAMPNNRVR